MNRKPIPLHSSSSQAEAKPVAVAVRVREQGRRVVVVSANAALRRQLAESLETMRWQVREAAGGAEAMAHLEEGPQDTLLLDAWLPDLEVGEFAGMLTRAYPELEVLRLDGGLEVAGVRGPRRQELIHALRKSQEGAQVVVLPHPSRDEAAVRMRNPVEKVGVTAELPWPEPGFEVISSQLASRQSARVDVPRIEGMVGGSAVMLELYRLVRLVAPRSTGVLIEGETGTGKELVAQSIHRLSARAKKPLVVLNCAAIPEALLEAELFGHTRGAFTGAVSSRTGRIEAADGGTLFLDEIGEMPLALQAKMLRFLESGELQRVGENAVVRVDVRIVAATHQHLEKRAADGSFRLDLYHRLAVFPLYVPALRDRRDDIAPLVEFFLAELGKSSPRKRISAGAMEVLRAYAWPGNVRELAHVLERATILAAEVPEIAAEHLRMGRRDLGTL